MKQVSILLAVSCVMIFNSCGPSEADIAKTCECEALFTKMKGMEGEYMISERISSSEASKKVRDENKDAYDKCIKLHNDMGDDTYFKASQKCAPK